MTEHYDYAVVDAFASEAYTGNPAAVVLDAVGLAEARMAAIAREFNLSETAFVLPAEAPGTAVRFRWFTPGAEVKMCGHATIAGVHALVEAGRFTALLNDPEAILPIQTASGTLRARMEPITDKPEHSLVWLELAPPRLTRKSLNPDKVARLLGLEVAGLDESLPVMISQDTDVLIFVRDCAVLQSINPDFRELGRYGTRHGVRGFCLATVKTLSPTVHVQSRFFAPAVGIDEDPVTGSVHGPLATYLVVNELVPMEQDKAALSCVQSSPTGRAGLVRALVERTGDDDYRVSIAGRCITTMRGTIVA
jgi:PhzF family phenazine biosynthesis protein